MKSVLISIQPKWCELIASGEKTVEVRKTRPKIETPFKVYIYCTKGNDGKYFWTKEVFDGEKGKWAIPHVGNGKVIGEFVCEEITDIHYHEAADGYSVSMSHPLCDFFAQSTCLKYEELHKYLQGQNGYGWHITDLVIYDKPRELDDFIIPSKIGCCNEGKCRGCKYFDRGNGYNVEDDCNAKFSTDDYKPLRKAPQSWCYVEWRKL